MTLEILLAATIIAAPYHPPEAIPAQTRMVYETPLPKSYNMKGLLPISLSKTS